MILPCDKQRCTCGFIVNKIFGERLDDNISISPDIGVRSGGQFIFELRISENGGEAWVLTVRHWIAVLDLFLWLRISHVNGLDIYKIKLFIWIEDMHLM